MISQITMNKSFIEHTHFNHSMLVFNIEYRHDGVNHTSTVFFL